jgi:hypothetical protein
VPFAGPFGEEHTSSHERFNTWCKEYTLYSDGMPREFIQKQLLFMGLVNRCPRALVKKSKKEKFELKVTLF